MGLTGKKSLTSTGTPVVHNVSPFKLFRFSLSIAFLGKSAFLEQYTSHCPKITLHMLLAHNASYCARRTIEVNASNVLVQLKTLLI